MPPIAVITDTDSSLPLDLAEKYNIVQIPIIVQFGEESFRDVYDIDNAAVFSRVDREGKLPTTAAPSPGDFVKAFKSAFDSGAEQILCLTISSEMSAVYTVARTAAEMFTGKTIRVVDSRTLAYGQGLMAIGSSQGYCRRRFNGSGSRFSRKSARPHPPLRCSFHIEVSGHERARRAGGGRSCVPARTEAHPDLAERKTGNARTRPHAGQGLERVIELTCEATGEHELEHLCILHVNAPEAASQFELQLRAALPCPPEIRHVEMTPGLSIHTGPGLVGVVVATKN